MELACGESFGGPTTGIWPVEELIAVGYPIGTGDKECGIGEWN